jgi:hypothetical protein
VTLRSRRTAAAAFAAIALGVLGCEPAVHNITVASPGTIAPDAHKVTVVVVQPVTRLRSVSLLDGRGQLVGQLDDRSHTVVHVPEGPTVLYAVLENRAETADRIEGTLVPGRIYYATVHERAGGVALLALNPRSPGGRWSHRDEYLRTTPRVQMDRERITRAVNEIGDPEPIINAAESYVAGLDPAARAEHEIAETDGN